MCGSAATSHGNTSPRAATSRRATSRSTSITKASKTPSPEGSFFGPDNIPYFNGGLFSDNRTIPLDHADLGILNSAAQHDWSHIEPVIFGTLFERSLDSAKRSMIGAHYTSPEDILLLIEPVVIDPLKRRWEAVRQSVLTALAEESPDPGAPSSRSLTAQGGVSSEARPLSSSHPETSGAPSLAASSLRVGFPKSRRTQPALHLNRPALTLLQNWAAELTQVRILDPACGSGNFLYIALKRLLDLWHEARLFGIAHGLTLALDPIPHPGQLYGIEIDFYAHEIASIVVWIGFLQWKHDHGVKETHSPLLKKLTNIEHNDAILRYDANNKPYEPTWPKAEYIIGNPPFLGGKLLRRELGDKYIDNLFDLYKGRVKAESDLVVYWFEKARAQLEAENIANAQSTRVGLLATQGIRGGANRNVLDRILQTGHIFWAWSDRPWLLAGATVHVSMIAFERTKAPPPLTPISQTVILSEGALAPQSKDPDTAHVAHADGTFLPAPCLLDGQPVPFINPDLTTGSNTTAVAVLTENAGISFQGPTKIGKFDIDPDTAKKMLSQPINPNGRPNSDVVKPWINGRDITGRPNGMYIIDFGVSATEAQAALFEMPFEHIRREVWPIRKKNKRALRARRWWLHGEVYPSMRLAISKVSRYIATPRVSKHRIFAWENPQTFPDSAIVLFAREDDYFFGALHSSIHELWARAQGTQLREVESGFRYTPNSTFDTFPFPWPPGTEPSEADSPIVKAIADAARSLVSLRDNWLNPKPAPGEPPIPESDLKKRTLTNLYNQRPAWLDNAHRTLDEAVFAAYGWPSNLTTQQILANLLALNHQRAAAQTKPARSSKK